MLDPNSLNDGKKKEKEYANADMLDRIKKLEDGMLGKDT